jgi:uncharacterized protein YndB with AHSA1/START domain
MSTEVVRELTIKASPETIFPYLVDSDKLVQWMGTEASLDAVPGGEFRVLCGGVNPSAGEFLEVVPDQKVVFTFGWDLPGHPIPAGSTEVEITLTAEGEQTLLRLTHRGLPDDAASDHVNGWNYYLGRLEKVIDGVDPGPDSANLGP